MKLIPVATAILCVLGGGPARADDFYRGKTISIIVGASPGGSFDIVSRALARRFGAHVPGNPGVVVQNMTGAASVTALRYVGSTAPHDGTTLGTFLPGVLTQSLVTPEKVNVDFGDFSWVGVVSADYSRLCYGYGPHGVKSWDDLMARGENAPFIMGTTGTGASNYINGMSLKLVLGAPVRIIMGFPGSAELRIGVERGELEGDCGGLPGVPQEWLRSGLAHPFVRFAEKLFPGMPESAVYVGALAKTERQRQFLDFLYAADKLGRPFVVSRQTPPDRLQILRTAFDATMRDETFLADMTRAQEPVAPLSGAEAAQVRVGMLNAPAEIVSQARALYQ